MIVNITSLCRAFFACASLILLGSASTPCFASSILFNYSGGSANSGQNATYGFLLTPVVNLTVDALGFIDNGRDGLIVGHRVGIWNNAGTLLASTTVTTANSTLDGPIVGDAQFRFTPIANLNLLAGQTYTVGAAVESASDVWFAGGTNISAVPSLASVSSTGVFVVNQGFDFPASSIGNRYAIVNLTAFASDVPEPSTVALAGMTLLALAVAKRRKTSA